ncbi:N-glycosylase/DNA lyase-like [Mercenaria mercenaria]|uniref:N-glycosylase/DNA lyase-like n=1 Tax=Mercenaria mercenaria TaxID=6596 RepID=UPI00234F8FDD|nr:N-glycosylase/DNA lyase-like [Mercenaria mercenaria]
MAAPMWKSVPCKISELCLDRALACGQSFRWKEYVPGVWTGVIGDAVWQLRQTHSELFYKVYRNTCDGNQESTIKSEIEAEPDLKTTATVKKRKRNTQKTDGIKCVKIKEETIENGVSQVQVKQEIQEYSSLENRLKTSSDIKHEDIKDFDILKDYFQLGIKLEDMYKTWSEADKHFEEISKQFTGIRMIRQDPVECLFSFICSSNNHISRITSMVDKLAEHYGQKILVTSCVDGVDFYTFPKIEALAAEGVDQKLRDLGFGYRAKYIQQSARFIKDNGGEEWLYSLRGMEYKDAKRNLVKLCGVGAKVADCVALMCLDKPASIPVDTHVWQIAARDYMPKLKQAKSLTDKLYDEIGDYFRNLWGPYAGWAHSVLFTADLKQFKDGKKESPKKKAVKRKSEDLLQETIQKSESK